MRRTRTIVDLSLYVLILLLTAVVVSAQFPIRVPKLNVDKPKTPQSATEANTASKSDSGAGAFDVLSPPRADSTPRFLRNSVEVTVRNESRYAKFPKQDHYHSWIPTVSFDIFFDNSITLR